MAGRHNDGNGKHPAPGSKGSDSARHLFAVDSAGRTRETRQTQNKTHASRFELRASSFSLRGRRKMHACRVHVVVVAVVVTARWPSLVVYIRTEWYVRRRLFFLRFFFFFFREPPSILSPSILAGTCVAPTLLCVPTLLLRVHRCLQPARARSFRLPGLDETPSVLLTVTNPHSPLAGVGGGGGTGQSALSLSTSAVACMYLCMYVVLHNS